MALEFENFPGFSKLKLYYDFAQFSTLQSTNECFPNRYDYDVLNPRVRFNRFNRFKAMENYKSKI